MISKETMQLFKDAARIKLAMVTGNYDNVQVDATLTTDDGNVNIIYNPYVFFNSMAKHINKNTICVNNSFMELSDITKCFVIGHELGYMYKEHKPGFFYAIKRLCYAAADMVAVEEQDADDYSVWEVGMVTPKGAIVALKELASYSRGLAKKELLMRAARHTYNNVDRLFNYPLNDIIDNTRLSEYK